MYERTVRIRFPMRLTYITMHDNSDLKIGLKV